MHPTLSLRITALATLLTVAFSFGCSPRDIQKNNKLLEVQQAIKKAKKEKRDAERNEPITITGQFCSMVVPPNWRPSDQRGRGRGGLLVHSVPVPEEGLIARVSMGVTAYDDLEKVKSSQQRDEKLRTLESESKFKVGGRDATKLITSKEVGGLHSRYVTFWVPLDNKTICFEAKGSPKEINAAMSDIESMLQSVKFLDKRGFAG